MWMYMSPFLFPFRVCPSCIVGPFLASWVRDVVAPLAKMAPLGLAPRLSNHIHVADGYLSCILFLGHLLLAMRAATWIIGMEKAVDKTLDLLDNVHGPSAHGQQGLSL